MGPGSQVSPGFALTAQNRLLQNVGLQFLYDLQLWVITVMCDHTHSEFCHLSSITAFW